MSKIVQFPSPVEQRKVEIVWKVRAYRRSDLRLLEYEYETEAEANAKARELYAQGFDITGRRHIIEHVADWVYDPEWSKNQ